MQATRVPAILTIELTVPAGSLFHALTSAEKHVVHAAIEPQFYALFTDRDLWSGWAPFMLPTDGGFVNGDEVNLLMRTRLEGAAAAGVIQTPSGGSDLTIDTGGGTSRRCTPAPTPDGRPHTVTVFEPILGGPSRTPVTLTTSAPARVGGGTITFDVVLALEWDADHGEEAMPDSPGGPPSD